MARQRVIAVALSVITPGILQAVLFLTWSARAFRYSGPTFIPLVQIALTLVIGYLIVARAKRLVRLCLTQGVRMTQLAKTFFFVCSSCLRVFVVPVDLLALCGQELRGPRAMRSGPAW